MVKNFGGTTTDVCNATDISVGEGRENSTGHINSNICRCTQGKSPCDLSNLETANANRRTCGTKMVMLDRVVSTRDRVARVEGITRQKPTHARVAKRLPSTEAQLPITAHNLKHRNAPPQLSVNFRIRNLFATNRRGHNPLTNRGSRNRRMSK